MLVLKKTNPVTLYILDNNYNVYVFPDGPHLLKLLRNHFVNSGFEINGNIITKKVIEDIILLNVDNEVTSIF